MDMMSRLGRWKMSAEGSGYLSATSAAEALGNGRLETFASTAATPASVSDSWDVDAAKCRGSA